MKDGFCTCKAIYRLIKNHNWSAWFAIRIVWGQGYMSARVSILDGLHGNAYL